MTRFLRFVLWNGNEKLKTLVKGFSGGVFEKRWEAQLHIGEWPKEDEFSVELTFPRDQLKDVKLAFGIISVLPL